MKVNKIEMFQAIANKMNEVQGAEQYIEFLNKEIQRLTDRNKKAAEKRAEKKDNAYNGFTDAILATLEDAGRAITLAEIVAGVKVDNAEVTPGRVTYYITQLVKAGKVAKDKVKVGDRKIMAYAIVKEEQGE